MPINESGSDSFWINDTIEVFRVCPEYGPENSSGSIVVVGRNFRDSDVLVCRFTPCMGTVAGPLNCEQLVSSGTTNDGKSVEVTAMYTSSTRVQCPVPDYTFPSNESLVILEGVCEYDDSGAMAYIQNCDANAISDGSCEEDAGTGQRFVYDTLVSLW